MFIFVDQPPVNFCRQQLDMLLPAFITNWLVCNYFFDLWRSCVRTSHQCAQHFNDMLRSKFFWNVKKKNSFLAEILEKKKNRLFLQKNSTIFIGDISLRFLNFNFCICHALSLTSVSATIVWRCLLSKVICKKNTKSSSYINWSMYGLYLITSLILLSWIW